MTTDRRGLTALPNAGGAKVPTVGRGMDYLAATIACSSAAGAAFEVVGVDR